MESNFDDIRPYVDAEISAAMERIAGSEHLAPMAKFVFPDKSLGEVQQLLRNFCTIHDFQVGAMYHFNDQVVKQTTTGFTHSGLEKLDPNKCYLFVSNHRDIVLDSSLLQFALHVSGLRTSEITFGSNLKSSQLVVDIGRSNKMFEVKRVENPRELYKVSLQLSEYIRRTITHKGESIWIAQRSGRTKDGLDATDQGLVKMFCMSGGKDLVNSIDELNIVPMAVSYQWEPCDLFKTRELYQTRNGEKYIKQKDEDFISVLAGITQPKGKVHISLCEPLRKEELPQTDDKDFHKKVVNLIDERIHKNYRLCDTNYIAHDLRSGSDQYASYYTPQAKEMFVQRQNQILAAIGGDKDVVSNIFLGIYANSVDVK